MVFEMDGIVEEMLQLTIQLEQEVMQSDSDPDKWLLYLDEREKMMRKIDTLISAGSPLSDANKISLAQIHDINQRIMPIISNRMQAVQKKLTEIQRSKTAMNTYHDAGPNAFGAFFDSKK
ncbi:MULTISPECIES: flagellar protein FliT [Brevibacillus]|uniref:Flagellar protein FliT n=1 Tax=Brevibacillus borstelensis AK1 TaxID=1300222 RepID=M8DYY7_9BACL|nr:flagellar protein FliT [Brevibacillus borstelensis]EMT52246.1 hypothetical protein I532_11354 [Brevibacillus borstelensis AK1]KKX54692.1 flagellar protein FliT [Brevibacillus borstelensis cifa_chp40]